MKQNDGFRKSIILNLCLRIMVKAAQGRLSS